jgi:N-acetylglutamate synthase
VIGAGDVEAIERATLAAVSPEAQVEVGPFLVGLGRGTIHRAKSAVPLRHDLEPDVTQLEAIEAAYAERGLSPAFRIADVPGLEPLRAALASRGYAPDQPTLVKTGRAERLAALAGDEAAEICAAPDESWRAVFLGPGFDPEDGAYRLQALSRGPANIFACVREEGRAVAVGVGAFGHGWLSVHGMRTDAGRRGRGLASRILATLARAAAERGVPQVFLQVLEANETARGLYRKGGLTRAWRYFYWSKTPS